MRLGISPATSAPSVVTNDHRQYLVRPRWPQPLVPVTAQPGGIPMAVAVHPEDHPLAAAADNEDGAQGAIIPYALAVQLADMVGVSAEV